MGPVKQLKRMCDKTRALATTIMIVSTCTHTQKKDTSTVKSISMHSENGCYLEFESETMACFRSKVSLLHKKNPGPACEHFCTLIMVFILPDLSSVDTVRCFLGEWLPESWSHFDKPFVKVHLPVTASFCCCCCCSSGKTLVWHCFLSSSKCCRSAGEFIIILFQMPPAIRRRRWTQNAVLFPGTAFLTSRLSGLSF